MYVIPASGLQIVDPDMNDRLPTEGREVPETAYWQRRIAEGSVTVGQAPAAPSAKLATPGQFQPADTPV